MQTPIVTSLENKNIFQYKYNTKMYNAIFKPVFMCTLLHLYSEEIYCFHCFLKEESGNGAGV